jgi:hypothetical protein
VKGESKNSEKILQFYSRLKPQIDLPEGISVMNPYVDPGCWGWVEKFYRHFYDDTDTRGLIFGINPGRHGGGITGIPFTDPIRLESECGIANNLRRQPELSSEFMYQMMHASGGPSRFYKRFLITAVSPLGFMKNGKNLNYYDDSALCSSAEKFIVECVRWHCAFAPSHDTIFCLGEGENFRYFTKLNERHGFFRKIIPLPHPRWIMQYRRKHLQHYIDNYLQILGIGDS